MVGKNQYIIDLLKVKNEDQSAHINYLNDKVDRLFIDCVADFGGWLIVNHNGRISGGEEQIKKLCSEFVESKAGKATQVK